MEAFYAMLLQQGPLVGVLCVVGFFMYKEIKNLQKVVKEKDSELKEMNVEVRMDGKENIKLFTEFSLLLESILGSQKEGQLRISETVKIETQGVKEHIDIKLLELKNKSD